MKVMLFVVDNLYNQNTNNTEDYVKNKYLTSLYQNWNEMYIISKYEKFTESDLIKFQVCITYIIIFFFLSRLIDLLQKVVWKARCDDQLQAEKILGIDSKSKYRHPPRTNSA